MNRSLGFNALNRKGAPGALFIASRANQKPNSTTKFDIRGRPLACNAGCWCKRSQPPKRVMFGRMWPAAFNVLNLIASLGVVGLVCLGNTIVSLLRLLCVTPQQKRTLEWTSVRVKVLVRLCLMCVCVCDGGKSHRQQYSKCIARH